jgi:hypothetical protein
MLVRIYSLLFVVTIRFDDEAVIGMDISTRMSEMSTVQKRVAIPRFVTRMVARSDAINIPSPSTSTKSVTVILRWRRKAEVHQMSNGGLTSPAIGIPHGSLGLLVHAG